MADGDTHSSAESEEWPDNDVDIYSEEGWKAVKKSAKAFHRSIERQAELMARGPEAAHKIPTDLYKKAELANDELTEEERKQLLGRGDLVGKALAYPDLLTQEERYEVARWAPAETLYPAIKRATDGAAETPEELYALAHEGPGDGSHLSPEARHILSQGFNIEAEDGSKREIMNYIFVPGNGEAQELILKRAGMDSKFFIPFAAAAMAAMAEKPPILPVPPVSESTKRPARGDWEEDLGDTDDDDPPKKRLITRDSRDAAGYPAWPSGYPPQLGEPCRLFYLDVMKSEDEYRDKYFEDVKAEVTERWEALGAEEREVYEARSEELRNRLWDEVDEDNERMARYVPGEHIPRSERIKLPGLDEFLAWQKREQERRRARFRPAGWRPPSPVVPDRVKLDRDGKVQWPLFVDSGEFEPFGLFCRDQRDLYPGQDLHDVWKIEGDLRPELLRRFEALDKTERAAYEARSEKFRQEAWDEYDAVEREGGAWVVKINKKWLVGAK